MVADANAQGILRMGIFTLQARFGLVKDGGTGSAAVSLHPAAAAAEWWVSALFV